ncbi:hypothetical protein [Persicobacter diffluens]|uniref:hypothetical protein n=1 Tax=Persicobacter diffluens TaxID=981 RepID=UPI0030C6F810
MGRSLKQGVVEGFAFSQKDRLMFLFSNSRVHLISLPSLATGSSEGGKVFRSSVLVLFHFNVLGKLLLFRLNQLSGIDSLMSESDGNFLSVLPSSL